MGMSYVFLFKIAKSKYSNKTAYVRANALILHLKLTSTLNSFCFLFFALIFALCPLTFARLDSTPIFINIPYQSSRSGPLLPFLIIPHFLLIFQCGHNIRRLEQRIKSAGVKPAPFDQASVELVHAEIRFVYFS